MEWLHLQTRDSGRLASYIKLFAPDGVPGYPPAADPYFSFVFRLRRFSMVRSSFVISCKRQPSSSQLVPPTQSDHSDTHSDPSGKGVLSFSKIEDVANSQTATSLCHMSLRYVDWRVLRRFATL